MATEIVGISVEELRALRTEIMGEHPPANAFTRKQYEEANGIERGDYDLDLGVKSGILNRMRYKQCYYYWYNNDR